ncbi:MAG: peptidase S9 [Acidobacteria bacterium RIFCSPLOWO2_02_FULL_67_36]|nr:MAG: peptidase S9 [Acidobacteria bacterium RIFCSPLOWO2_02_FULL_67_36]OFW24688.1 MAG: peptidase S9 [Acidobacteria bacterium RIFCSPLOWO2_12_FULL_66_21]
MVSFVARHRTGLLAAICVAEFAVAVGSAQQRSGRPGQPAASRDRAVAPAALTAADYARAEKFMGYNTTPLVYRSGVRPTWLPDDRFWYAVTTAAGPETVLVDASKGTKSACDLPACAEARRTAGRGGRGGQGGGRGAAAPRNDVVSPDGKRAVFIRDWNLWVRDVATRKETPLTSDGVKDFGYATDNAGWTKSDRPIVMWSPDSKKVATFQQDQRNVGEWYLVTTKVGHPELQAWKYPLPGDRVVSMIHRVVIDVDAPKVVRFKMDPDQHRSTLCDNLACRGNQWEDVQWNPDSSNLAFASTSRDHKKTWLRVADAATGAVRDVLEETVPTFFESGNGRINWRYLPASNEVIWFSERDNWGQLYLHDLQTGKLKQQITAGEGNVTQLLRVDEKNRVLFFQGVGKEKGRDPYFTHFYRIGMDGRNLALLTPEDANHDISLAESGKYFVDSYSKPDVPAVAVLRDAGGTLILDLEKADITKLVATGWKPPTPITVKARDGQTDLHGLMYRPTTLEPGRKYPIVNHIYPGPQTGSVGGRSFSAARGDSQALAELGFIVVEIDGMGTPWRSKKFHEAYYGDMADNTLPDQVTGMKQLAAKHPYIDIDRAGIWGHSGGGFATGSAMFHYPDFFKVGISESGNHDNRVYEDDWAEKWVGLLEKKPDGTSNYDSQANQNFAKNLKGHLLLAHGTIDSNVPPENTLLVVEALIKANRDFDLIMMPNQAHGYGPFSNYMTRRRWDYFVRYLMGAEPPKEYELTPPDAPGPGRSGGAGLLR